MRPLPTWRAVLILALAACPAPADGPTADQPAEAARRHGLDPATPPEGRVKPTPASVLKMFEDLGGPAPMPHALTDAERTCFDAAGSTLSVSVEAGNLDALT